MLLYHGSNFKIEYPQLLDIQRRVDFGKGFYCTTNYEQAAAFSKKVFNRTKKGIPIVSLYNFELQENKLVAKVFEEPNLEWLDFVTKNRVHENFEHNFDIVIGPVANDDVFGTLAPYFEGFITAQQAVSLLKVKKLYNQYVFCSQNSLNLLKFEKGETIE